MQEPQRYDQTAVSTRHYHEPVNPHDSNRGINALITLSILAFFALVGVGAVAARQTLVQAGILFFYGSIVLIPLIMSVIVAYLLWHKHYMDGQKRKHAELDVRAKEYQVASEKQIAEAEAELRLAEARRIDAEAERLRILIPFDDQGNAAIRDPRTWQVVQLQGNMREHPGLHSLTTNYRYDYKDASTKVTEEGQPQNLLAGGNLHIPTFAESLASGDIGPGQRDMLFCYELIEDEVTRTVTGISPIRGEIEAQHTQLVLAGSQSGKTTYMSSNMAQAAVLGTLFYIVDPHKSHPEKSIAAKMAAYAPWFILPPASSHDEIRQFLRHATKVRDARINPTGRPSPYDGYHIMVVIDEVPALMANQRSSDKNIRQLYIDLALFMQSLGIQTAKYGITGLFASQFATKEQLGEIDFRDACMSQLIMRLHPTQAQAMRVLGKEAVREIPKFPKGHGYLLLSDSSETRRVAAGNVTPVDLATLARGLPPSPLVKPVQKVDRNQLESRSIIPIRDGVETTDFTSETSEKYGRNQSRNQLEGTLQAKLEQVRQLIASGMVNKGDLLAAVWGVRPGSSDKYKQAEQEYKQIMTCLAERGA